MLLAAALLLAAVDSSGQHVNDEAGRAALRVFLDCNAGGCDANEFRTEIRFVDWVRDRTAADVHVLVTQQSTGGGREYTLDFIGLGQLARLEDRLLHRSSSTDTRDEILRGLTGTLRAGLVRFLAHAGQSDRIDVVALDPRREPDPTNDPWNLWVFRAGLGFELSGEERETSREIGGSFSASRTTGDWKLDFEVEGESDRREVELNSGGTFVDVSDDWEIGGLIVRTLGGHWGSGIAAEVGTSTSANRRIAARWSAAVEWNYFPYDEANRRQLIVHYSAGLTRVGYEERTIFDYLWETRGSHLLTVAYSTRQPWGDASVALRHSNYLHDWELNRTAVEGGLGFRVFRGLDLFVSGSYERIRDQIYLSSEGLSDEEILVRRRDQATGYEYEVDVGFSYRFGSIFNNVVNNRFPGSVRFF